MSKKRWQALVLAGAVLMSMFLGGCKTSKKEKEKKSKGAEKKAEAMLDDFCAYLKSGKYEKLEKLIDGDSKGVAKLLGFKDSPAEYVHEAARKRISYSIESVTVDEKKESGEATVVITYFDVKDLKKKIYEDYSIRDICRAVGEAKELDLEFDVDLVLDDEWLIDAGSVDTIVDELYSFMEEIDLDVEPTVSTTKVKELTEFSSSWQDEYYNTVEGYHQSAKYIKYSVILWENCYGETVRYEFEDDNGVAYSGECYLDGGTDMVECIWEPTSKITSDWIACYVYDANGGIISVGCAQIYGDDEQIPVNNVYIYDVCMVDENGQKVPGYHINDTYIAAEIEMGNYGQNVELTYEFARNDGGSSYSVYPSTTSPYASRLVPTKLRSM